MTDGTQTYITTKIVTAKPQSRHGEDGYQVNYPDGYTSWCPRHTFHDTAVAVGQVRHLPAHIQRVVAELAQLVDRIGKLEGFVESRIFPALEQHERDDLKFQVDAMRLYRDILLRRLRPHLDPLKPNHE